MSGKLQVLVLCTANSVRSQMGEGLLRQLAGDRVDVFSAGTKPSHVSHFAISAMRDRGIDITLHKSDHLNKYLQQDFDYVITVCDSAAESCPIFRDRATRIHWSLLDPAAVDGGDEEVLQSFIEVRNDLEDNLREWLSSLG